MKFSLEELWLLNKQNGDATGKQRERCSSISLGAVALYLPHHRLDLQSRTQLSLVVAFARSKPCNSDSPSVQMEQRLNIKFLVKFGKTGTEAYVMFKEVYDGYEWLSHTQVFEWFKSFTSGEKRPKTIDNPTREKRTPALKKKIYRLTWLSIHITALMF